LPYVGVIGEIAVFVELVVDVGLASSDVLEFVTPLSLL
jgi:hypothetical protein